MANTFSFQLSASFLRAYADYLAMLERDTGKAHQVTLTVDLIPDGVGCEISYETSGMPQITVEEIKTDDK